MRYVRPHADVELCLDERRQREEDAQHDDRHDVEEDAQHRDRLHVDDQLHEYGQRHAGEDVRHAVEGSLRMTILLVT